MLNRDKNTSRLRNSQVRYELKYDVNSLLSYFHQIDKSNSGLISYPQALQFFTSLKIKNPQKHLSYNLNQMLQFDHILSILGIIQQLQQPSLYVISFVNILANFKNQRLKQEGDNGLQAAKQIDKKIKEIVKKEIQRKIKQIVNQNAILIEQIDASQRIQIQKFQEKWKTYLKETQQQAKKKVNQTIDFRNKSFYQKESLMAVTSRRRYSVLTSKKLIQLQEKKKKLINESKYDEALLIKEKIADQKQNLRKKHQNQTKLVATRRYQSLNKKKDSFFQTTIMLANNNVKRMYKKKKEEQELMKIRLATLKKETIKKLDQKIKNQVSKLKSLFYQAAKG